MQIWEENLGGIGVFGVKDLPVFIVKLFSSAPQKKIKLTRLVGLVSVTFSQCYCFKFYEINTDKQSNYEFKDEL